MKSAFERGYKVIVPQGANSTFDNDYMTGEITYKYYNDMMWPNRFATCVSVDEAIKLIEACSPGPYLELFARGERDGWTLWGNQANERYSPDWPTYHGTQVASL